MLKELKAKIRSIDGKLTLLSVPHYEIIFTTKDIAYNFEKLQTDHKIWHVKRLVKENKFYITWMRGGNRIKHKVINHKPLFDGERIKNPMRGKQQFKIGLGINRSKTSVENQIKQAYLDILNND